MYRPIQFEETVEFHIFFQNPVRLGDLVWE